MANKEVIIQAAIEVIRTEGISKYSLARVAKCAKITKAAIFYHFKNKEELTHALISHIINEYNQALAREYERARLENHSLPYTKAYMKSNLRQLNDSNLLSLHSALLITAVASNVDLSDWDKTSRLSFLKMKQEIGAEMAELVRYTIEGMWHANIFHLKENDHITKDRIGQLLQKWVTRFT